MTSSKNLEITGSRHLINWLETQQISLALTTYQSYRLFLLGVKPDGNLSGFMCHVLLILSSLSIPFIIVIV